MPKINSAESYNDIINLSRPTSKTYPKMPREKRAAQFRAAQFAAVTFVQISDLKAPDVTDYGPWDDWYGDQTDVWCE